MTRTVWTDHPEKGTKVLQVWPAKRCHTTQDIQELTLGAGTLTTVGTTASSGQNHRNIDSGSRRLLLGVVLAKLSRGAK
jgi:hypothetical protein